MPNNIRRAALILLLATSTNAFCPGTTSPASFGLCGIASDSIESAIERAADYQPGAANTDFARRYGSLKGVEVRTVGAAFADFTKILGVPVNALYKNMMTDMVGTTHLTAVNARFKRDGIWSLGMLTALDLLLKNYPEQDAAALIKTSLFECVGMIESEVREEAKTVSDWVAGKSREDITEALTGAGSSPLADITNSAKADEYWMYSRFFGIGLVSIMEEVGCASSADDVFPVMEEWMTTSMGKSHFTACTDSDTYFKIKAKLDLMETMMKEIEIREKKRMAQRLEEKAEAAIAAAEREEEFAKETEMEAEEKVEEKVEAKVEEKVEVEEETVEAKAE